MNKLRLTGLLLTRLLGLWLVYVSCVQVGYAQQSGGGNYPTGNGVRVREVDGSPNVPGTQTLVFPNGSLTRAGQTVTVTIAGGTTINSTNGQVPYRVNATTFGDSAFASNALNSTYLSATSGASGAGLTLAVAGGGASETLNIATKGDTSAINITYGSAFYLKRTVAGGSNSLSFLTSGGTLKGQWGLAEGAGIGVIGTAANDMFFRAQGGAFWFSVDSGVTGAAVLDSNGRLIVGSGGTADAQLSVYSQSTTRPSLKLRALSGTSGTQNVFESYNAAGTLTFSVRADGTIALDKTITAGGTTGAQTINKSSGSVNFAAAATSVVVTNSLVTANSNIICTVQTNDTTMKDAQCVPGSGSFTIYANAAATAETRVGFIVFN